MVKKLPFEEFKSIYSRVPRLCVDTIIKKDNGIILTKREIEPWKGMWHMPGGTVLLGETLLQAAERNVKEETDVEIHIEKMLDIMEFFENFPDMPEQHHMVSLVFLASYVSGELKGSFQAQDVEIFHSVPKNTLPQHKALLLKHADEIFGT